MRQTTDGGVRARGPLSGYRVVDFSENMAGPFGTMILADQGADVIKVEPPRGDALRHAGTGSRQMGAYFANLNRSKRSVALDLRREESRPVLSRLLDSADVVVQSFRPRPAEELGVDATAARSGRTRLVHVSVVGFGVTGPLAGKPVYDHVIQAVSGMAALQADGPASPPQLVRHGLVDKATGHVLAQSVCAALLHRAATGEGVALSIAMLDVALAFLWPDALMDKTALAPELRLPPASDTFRLTPTADGFVAVVVFTDAQWDALARAVKVDPTGMRRGDLLREARACLATLPTDKAVELLQRYDVVCGPVVGLDDVPAHPQVVANGSLGLYDHPAIGMLRQPRPVPRFPGMDDAALAPAPLLGQHTADVLTSLGFTADAVHTLENAGVIRSPATSPSR